MLQGLPFWSSAGRGREALSVTNLVLAAAQPLAAYAPRLTGRGVSEAERASKVDGPVSPAPGAFVIWLPLFATSLAHGARITRVHPRAPGLRRANWLMSAAYSCNAAWSLQAQLRGLGWPSVAIISAAAASASAALVEAERVSHRSHDARLTASAVAPLAGWLTLATFANVEATLNETGGRPDGRRETQRSLALLSAACVTAGAISLASRGNPLYTAAVAWGLGGVTVRNARSRNWAVTVAAGLGLAAAVGATLFGRRWARGR
jgi:branched-subunit amino acid ABC-type transport system permease component